jgi:hypothetical protein
MMDTTLSATIILALERKSFFVEKLHDYDNFDNLLGREGDEFGSRSNCEP